MAELNLVAGTVCSMPGFWQPNKRANPPANAKRVWGDTAITTQGCAQYFKSKIFLATSNLRYRSKAYSSFMS